MKNNLELLILIVTISLRNSAVADVLVQPGYDQPHQTRANYQPYEVTQQQQTSEPATANFYKYYWPHQFVGVHPAQVNQPVGYPLIHYPYHYRYLPRYSPLPPRHLHLTKIGGLKVFEPSWYLNNHVANPLPVHALHRYRRSVNESSDNKTLEKIDRVAENPPLVDSSISSILYEGKNIDLQPNNNNDNSPLHIPLNLESTIFPLNSEQQHSDNNEKTDQKGHLKEQLNFEIDNAIQKEQNTEEKNNKKITQRQINYQPTETFTSAQTKSLNEDKDIDTLSKNADVSATPVFQQISPISEEQARHIPYGILHTIPMHNLHTRYPSSALYKLLHKRPRTGNLLAPETAYSGSTLTPTHYYYYNDYYNKYLPQSNIYSPYSSSGAIIGLNPTYVPYQQVYEYPNTNVANNQAEQQPQYQVQYHSVADSQGAQEISTSTNVLPPTLQYLPQSYNNIYTSAQAYNLPMSSYYWTSAAAPYYPTFYSQSSNSGVARIASYSPLVHARLT